MSTIGTAALAAWSDLTEQEQFYAIGVLSCDAPEILLRAANIARDRARHASPSYIAR
ncbi:hypothetical protein QM787_04200 [Rhodococcus ruber]|uniref:Uncharacterized protein n=1 Tax=Rhodococcus ruber TaxID=1830 RepID=A0A098BVU2_9NOCA|nr:hypothetical protein [Rhodococcus ruber]MCD2127702.1 hypothetical protein [Rhodococcus ruber]MCZ4504360.1 hypothetical protein [Rhodococcus ruber]MCZ4529404.1 hypothetical protein [Rhodococcus ruber]MCZ4621021.1 hypothetical protein [Rhodococcus ruber]MDI9967045.1 hypothetical protein [Rhodococcus ruber]